MFHRLGGCALLFVALLFVSAGCLPNTDTGVDPANRKLPGNSGSTIDPNKVDDTTEPVIEK